MKSYLIGYDLNRPHQEYSSLIEEIKKFDGWWHSLDSTWIVKSNLTVAEIRDRLVVHIDQNDELLVAGLSGFAAWRGFPPHSAKWLVDYLANT